MTFSPSHLLTSFSYWHLLTIKVFCILIMILRLSRTIIWFSCKFMLIFSLNHNEDYLW
jgi:hypothetical protein